MGNKKNAEKHHRLRNSVSSSEEEEKNHPNISHIIFILWDFVENERFKMVCL